MVGDDPVEYCFKTIARAVGDQSDDDEDDDDDDDEAAVGQQITRKCCEGWYTPEGKPLCSAKNRTYIKQATNCDLCDKMNDKLEALEKIIKSQSGTRGSPSIGYMFIRYLKEKISSLEKAYKKQEEKIKYLEDQMLNLTSSFQTGVVVEFTPSTEPPVERAALSLDPCEAATCPDHPEAMCMVTSRCGRDIAVFVDGELQTVNCNRNEPCNLLPPTFCPDDPCLGVQCDGYPDAICIVTECDCKPSFMLPDGSTPSCANAHTFTSITQSISASINS